MYIKGTVYVILYDHIKSAMSDSQRYQLHLRQNKNDMLGFLFKIVNTQTSNSRIYASEKKNCQNSTLEKKLRYIPLYSSDSGFKGTLVNSDGQCKHANLLY